MSDFEDGDGGNQFQSMGITVVRGQHPTHAIEKIIRERIFDSLYWKEKCFALNAASVLDLAADLTHIGGTFSNQKPTEFLCLTLKLLQLQPEMDIIAEYLKQEDFKYIRALGAFYLRLVGSAATVFQHLEPLLNDFRKLRFRNSGKPQINYDYSKSYNDPRWKLPTDSYG
jgi:pre-mRNA-splicing factor 38A